MFLLFLVDRTYDNIGTALGFVGCMRRVKLGRRSVAFHVPPEGKKVSRKGRHYEDGTKRRGNSIDNNGNSGKSSAVGPPHLSTVVKMTGITQCGENPCWKSPCANEGTCVWKSGDNYTCLCRPGFTGSLLQQQKNRSCLILSIDNSTLFTIKVRRARIYWTFVPAILVRMALHVSTLKCASSANVRLEGKGLFATNVKSINLSAIVIHIQLYDKYLIDYHQTMDQNMRSSYRNSIQFHRMDLQRPATWPSIDLSKRVRIWTWKCGSLVVLPTECWRTRLVTVMVAVTLSG